MFLLALFVAERCFFLNDSQQPAALCYSKCTSYTYRWCSRSYVEILPPQKPVWRSMPYMKLPEEIFRTKLCISLSLQSLGKSFLCVLVPLENRHVHFSPRPGTYCIGESEGRVSSTSFSFWRVALNHFECQLLTCSLSAWFLLPSNPRNARNQIQFSNKAFLQTFHDFWNLILAYYLSNIMMGLGLITKWIHKVNSINETENGKKNLAVGEA